MGFLNTNSMPRLVEKLADGDNIKITGNSKGNRVGTVVKKIVEKADEVTKAIEQEVVNDSYSFKVGTGDVDVSADVEDGFGEVGIKGVTYQNLLGTLVAVGKEWVESDNKYILNLPSGSGQPQIRYNLAYPLKPNTKYTLICEIKEYTVGYPHFCFMTKDNRTLASTTEFTPNSVGIKTAILTTKSDVNAELLRILPRNNTDNIYSIGKNIILLEGDHTNNPNLPSYFEGIVGVGDKSKNLFDKSSIILNTSIQDGVWVNSSDRFVSGYISAKPNTTYCCNQTFNNLYCFDKDKKWLGKCPYSNKKMTTLKNTSFIIANYVTSTTNIETLQIEEGSIATTYEPYHDGYKIEILSHGKNLYKPNLQTKSANGLTFSLHGNTLIVNGTSTKIVDFRPINGTESITLELYNYVSKLPVGTTLKLSNNLGLKNFFSLKRNGAQTYPANTLIIQEGDYNISCFVRFEEGQSYNNAELKIQLEINNVATEFEPYIEDKTQILLDEPLMRLPNGVCDEITRDGKLIRRVGKVVLTDIKDWYKALVEEKTIRFAWHGKYDAIYKSKAGSHGYCDTVLYHKDNSDDKVHCRINGATPYGTLIFWVDKSQLTTETSEGFKQWLSQNPTTVYYELAEPIITELPAPYLRIFKDGHLTFNTLVAPESTHLVQLNKSAQIERSIREVQGLDSRVGQLESFYDDMMLETSHKLNLLTYDFEYTKESEDI